VYSRRVAARRTAVVGVALMGWGRFSASSPSRPLSEANGRAAASVLARLKNRSAGIAWACGERAPRIRLLRTLANCGVNRRTADKASMGNLPKIYLSHLLVRNTNS
jgi:hypothetical protein